MKTNRRRESCPSPTTASSVPDSVLEEQLKTLNDLAISLLEAVKSLNEKSQTGSERRLKLADEVRNFEIYLICLALRKTNGNQTHAAKFLNLNTTTLNDKIKRYRVRIRKDFKSG